MLSIEDTERLISAMRMQARALDAGADSLEMALAPMKTAVANIAMLDQASRMMADFWTGKLLTSSIPTSTKVDRNI